jgi:hypothetical protein
VKLRIWQTASAKFSISHVLFLGDGATSAFSLCFWVMVLRLHFHTFLGDGTITSCFLTQYSYEGVLFVH